MKKIKFILTAFFSWIKGQEDENSWEMKNYIIAGVGFLLWLFPGVLYIYYFNRKIDNFKTKQRHKELITAIDRVTAVISHKRLSS